MSKIKKTLKPIEIDAHLKYRCPNSKCGQEHWLNLIESQIKNFKIVCSCGDILKPKQIKNIKVKYVVKHIPQQNNIQETITPEQPEPQIENPISERLLLICCKTLTDYGFTKKEAFDLLKQSYIQNPTEQPLELINNTLVLIGKLDDTDQQTN